MFELYTVPLFTITKLGPLPFPQWFSQWSAHKYIYIILCLDLNTIITIGDQKMKELHSFVGILLTNTLSDSVLQWFIKIKS